MKSMKSMKSIKRLDISLLEKPGLINLYKGDIVNSIDIYSLLIPHNDYGLIRYIEFKIKYISQGQQKKKIKFTIMDPREERVIDYSNLIIELLEKIILSNDKISSDYLKLYRKLMIQYYVERDSMFKVLSKWSYVGMFSFTDIIKLLEYDR